MCSWERSSVRRGPPPQTRCPRSQDRCGSPRVQHYGRPRRAARSRVWGPESCFVQPRLPTGEKTLLKLNFWCVSQCLAAGWDRVCLSIPAVWSVIPGAPGGGSRRLCVPRRGATMDSSQPLPPLPLGGPGSPGEVARLSFQTRRVGVQGRWRRADGLREPSGSRPEATWATQEDKGSLGGLWPVPRSPWSWALTRLSVWCRGGLLCSTTGPSEVL